MPYIKQEKREEVDTQLGYLIDAIVDASARDVLALPGILNYCITRMIKTTYKVVTNKEKLSYADHNSAVGMLECAKQEFYRRNTAPYEDEKVVENGDV
jgi:hypothetical protein